MIATRFNQLPPQSDQGYFTVDNFRDQVIGANAWRYGVFVSYGHAGSLEGGIAVENYEGTMLKSTLDDRVADLIATPRYVDGELFAFAAGSNERVIAITKEFIANQARFADKSYAFAYGCKSFAAFNRNASSPNDPTAADVTFLDPAVGGVYFVGIRSLCPINNTVYYSYLRKMLGDEVINNRFSNYTVKQALDDDISGLLVARPRNNDFSVNRMRLWNQKKILKGELKQGTNDIYQYAYADQVFPFNQAFYPGDLSQAALRPAAAGELTAKFTFSGSMDSAWGGFKVKLVPPGAATPLDFVTDGWTQTNFPNDTWTGRVTIPSTDPGWEGTATVSVTARDASQDSDDPGGTLDNDGDGATDGPNTLVTFCAGSCPTRANLGKAYVSTPPTATTPAAYGLTGSAESFAGLASVKIFASSVLSQNTLTAASYETLPSVASQPFAPDTTSGLFQFTDLPPGEYSVVAKSLQGILNVETPAVKFSETRRTVSLGTDCRSQIQPRNGYVELKRAINGSYASQGWLSDVFYHSAKEPALLATGILGIHASTGSFLSPQPGEVTALTGSSTGDPGTGEIQFFGQSGATFNPYLELGPIQPSETPVPIQPGSVLIGASPRFGALLKPNSQPSAAENPQGPGFVSPFLYKAEIDLVQNFAEVFGVGAGQTLPYSTAAVPSGATAAALNVGGRVLDLQFPGGAAGPATATAALIPLSVDRLCGKVSGLEGEVTPGGTRATAIHLSGNAMLQNPVVSVPLDPSVPQASREKMQPWRYANGPPDAFARTLDAGGGRMTFTSKGPGTLTVTIPTSDDAAPPTTQLVRAPGAPATASGDPIYGLQKKATFESSDSAAGSPSGVLLTEVSVDGRPFQNALSPLNAEHGFHTLSYRSWDEAGNLEPTQASTIAIDGVAPTASLSVTGASLTDRLGRLILSTGSAATVVGTDPPVDGIAAGVGSVLFSVGTAPAAEVAGSSAVLTLTEGSYLLSTQAKDRVDNLGTAVSTSLIVDASPPSFGAASAAPAGGTFQPASVAISTTKADAAIQVSDLAAGLDVTGTGTGAVPLAVIPGNTLGLWHFDEGSGAVAADAAGVAGPGTLNSGVVWVPGKIGNAVRVSGDGSSSWGVTLAPPAYSVINNMSAGTIELWGKLIIPSASNGHTFTTKQHNGSDTMFYFGWEGSAMSLRWQASNAAGSCLGSYPALTNDQWHHFAVTWTNAASKLYLDGNLLATCGGVTIPNDTSPTCLSIAGGCGDGATTGKRDIDEVRVLNVALSGAQIAQDATAQAGAYSARVSVDGGQTFSALSASALSLTGTDGITSTQTLTAQGLTLAASTSPTDGRNVVEFSALDMSGRTGTARRTLLVNLNAVTLPLLVAPADGAAASSSTVLFQWRVAAGVPEASITGYMLQLARDAGFTVATQDVAAATNSISLAIADGNTYWRVSALDRFGAQSPYSAARRVSLDSQPPVFGPPEVAVAGSTSFAPAARPQNTLSIDARATVRDVSSGLAVTATPGGATAPPVIAGTLGLWHFDEGSGTVTADAAGVAGPGTLNAGVAWVPGKIGNAVRVSATGALSQGVTLAPAAYSVINNMPAGTIELWGKLIIPSSSNNHTFTTKQHNGANTMFYFGWEGSAMSLRWQASNGSGSCLGNYPTLTNDAWHHFAVTWTASASRLYLDGSLLATCGGVAIPNDTSPTCLSIAGGCGDGAATGTRDIDEVRVLNVALSGGQIAQDAASPAPVTPYLAAVSTNGGATFAAVSSAAVTLTGVDGSNSTETLTARNLSLVESASLASPLNVVRLTASDLTGQTTTLAFAVLVDTTPPVVAVSIPPPGSVYSTEPIIVRVSATDRLDPAPAVTARLVQVADVGGNGPLDTLAVSTGTPIDVFLLDPGSWTATAEAVDFAGNVSSAVSGVFRIERDVLPPQTELLVQGPRFGDAPIFVSPRSSISLSAFDDSTVLNDHAGVGVAASSYSIDSNAVFIDYPGPFSIGQQTAHDVRYFSLDALGHLEGVKLASVAVDGTGPSVALEYHAPFKVFAGTTTVFVQGLGTLAISATDYPALAVGTTATYLSVDGGAASAAGGPFALPGGLRQLAFWGVDSLGNQGATVTASVKLDDARPAAVADLVVTALSSTAVTVTWSAPGDDGAFGDFYDAAVRLDFGSNPGALAQRTVLSSGALAAGTRFEETFTGLLPGTTYYAVAYTRDTAGNLSAPSALASARTFSVAVSQDGVANFTSPVPAVVTVVSTVAAAQAYTVAISSQGLTPSGTVFYELTSGLTFSTAAPAVISFTFDPLLVEPASVRIYTYDTASGAWTSDSIFNQTLVVLDSGLYRISGEILHTSLYAPMVRDTAAPRTVFSFSGSSAVLEGRLFTVAGSSGILTAEDLAPRGGVRSGVAGSFYKVGAGAESAYLAPFPLLEGDLSVAFRSIDANGNREDAKTARVFLDASAPVLALNVDQSTFAVPGGFGTLSSTVTLTLSATDPEVNGARSGLAGVLVSVNGAPVLVTLQAGDAVASTSVVLAAGLNTVSWGAADRLGHGVSREVKVAVGDTTPPVTTLAVGFPKVVLADASILVSAASQLTLTATDAAESVAASGVAAIYRRFTPDPFAPYAGAFSAPAPDGAKTLEFYAVDAAGNAENPPQRQALVLDATPPSLAAKFPNPADSGLCRLAQGRVEVRGSVGDAHLAHWDLNDGGVLLGSGTASVDGLLGVWDATGKTGSFELRLTAADLVENAATLNLSMQAGQPARTLALGGKQVLNKPRGVATGQNRIYVSDSNADAVRVYDAAGTALAVLGDKKGSAKLNKPAGLVLDGTGNILVADANNKRVVKLSPAGAFLAEYGKGLLQRPMAVALSAGRIVVADAKAGRLLVFSDAGTVLARVDLPNVTARHDEEDEEDEPRPVALASDGAGNVWVADAKGGRVLRYTSAFALTQTIPGFERPEGVAVSASGACLAVADAKTSRIRTFDAERAAGLVGFGTKGEIKENRALTAEFFLSKPAQLAFDAAGTLLVADRNNDLIQGFGLPGAPVVVAMGTPGRSGRGARLSSSDGEPGAVLALARVGRLEGGRVENPDGAAVEIPAGALAEDLDVGVAKAADSGDEHRAREAARTLVGLTAASPAQEFSPHGLTFAEPAVITLPYDALLAAAPRELKIHYWNADRGAWEALPSDVDEVARTVSARVSHFSVYQVLGQAGAVNTMADPEAGFAFRAIYAFPNPAVGGQKPTVHVAVGRADKVTIRFYDVAGTPVHEATLDAPSVVNDESGPHLAYEYAWDGHIPSGVYLYAVTAEKAGYAPIKRIGKLAVVR